MLSSTWILVKSVKMNIFHANNRRGTLCLSQGRQIGYPACWMSTVSLWRPSVRSICIILWKRYHFNILFYSWLICWKISQKPSQNITIHDEAVLVCCWGANHLASWGVCPWARLPPVPITNPYLMPACWLAAGWHGWLRWGQHRGFLHQWCQHPDSAGR